MRVLTASAGRAATLAVSAVLSLLVATFVAAAPSSATVDPPSKNGNCAHTDTTYIGIVAGVGNGKDKSGTITRHNEAAAEGCLTRTAHHVQIYLQWDTVGKLRQGTFGSYVRDCTTKKWTLVTYLSYAYGSKSRRGAKTTTISFTSRHKVQPVVQGDGAYSRQPLPVNSGASGHFAALHGFRGYGSCV